ncbi:MAG: hypothetical protein ACPGTP_07715, partial [Bacteroidia bacterium]
MKRKKNYKLLNVYRFVLVLFLISFTILKSLAQEGYVELRNEKTAQSKNFHLEVQELGITSNKEAIAFLASYLEWDKADQLVPTRNLKSDGESHFRYQHVRNGIPILGSEIILHKKGNLISSINGIVYNVRELKPTLEVDLAREVALNHTQAKSFKWQNPSEDSIYKVWKNDPLATY